MKVPASVADLDFDFVVKALAKHDCNVTDAAKELGVTASDLRRLRDANPKLQDQAFEEVEARLDLAERNLYEDLRSEDRRIRAAATFYTLKYTASAKKRGLVTGASGGMDLTVNANGPTALTFSWRTVPPKIEAEPSGPLIEHDEASGE